MADTSDTGDVHDPSKIREEVEHELEELAEDASEEEIARMAERDEAGVDEPS